MGMNWRHPKLLVNDIVRNQWKLENDILSLVNLEKKKKLYEKNVK